MHIRSPKDFWSGAIFIAIAVGFIVLSLQYRIGDIHRMGPAMFPTLVGVLLALLGSAIAIRSFVIDGPKVPSLHARPLILSLIAIVSFGLAFQWFGLIAAIAVLVMASAQAARDIRLWQSAALAAFLIVFSVAVFVWLLGLPIPLWPDS